MCRRSRPGHKQVTHTSQCLGFPTCKMGKLTVNPLIVDQKVLCRGVIHCDSGTSTSDFTVAKCLTFQKPQRFPICAQTLLVKMMTCEKQYAMSSLLSHQQQEDPGAQRELFSICPCVCREGCGETSSWAQWGLVGHSVIQQPPLYLLSISPELWTAWAQSKAPATHGSQSRTGRGHGPGSLISPSELGSTFMSSSLGGLHLAPALGPSEAFCPLAQPLSCRLEARPPLLVASLCVLGGCHWTPQLASGPTQWS